MSPTENLRRTSWIAAVPLLLMWPAVSLLILRFGLHLSWTLVIALSGGYLLAEAVAFLIFWYAAKRRNKRGAPVGIAILALGFASVLYVSGQKAGFIGSGFRPAWTIGTLGLLLFALLPFLLRRKQRGYWPVGEVPLDCARCGHFHELRDCECGCRADQFRYQNAGL